MGRSRRDQDLRVGGMNLRTKFTSSMTLSLAVVMVVAAFFLSKSVTTVAENAVDSALQQAVELTSESGTKGAYRDDTTRGSVRMEGGIVRYPIVVKTRQGDERASILVKEGGPEGRSVRLLVPDDEGRTGRGLVGLIVGIVTLVLGVGALVAVVVANQVSAPIEALVDDVRQISHGNLAHRTKVTGAREIVLLGKTIDRMAASLRDSQEAELELMARERELEVAGEVREALLPEGTPSLPGHEVDGLQIGCPEPGGDFYDYIEREDGKLGLLLCAVSGTGVPGALVAATARSYLRAVLATSSDVKEGLSRVNRQFAPDVRRGMFVTALYAELDPGTHEVTVACAGHKVPLLRYTHADGKLRKVHPEGIALGFDKGSIFERGLELETFTLEPGDRLVLSNTGPIQVHNESGEELGEQGFFRGVLTRATLPTHEFLEDLDLAFETFAGEEELPADISLVTVRRTL